MQSSSQGIKFENRTRVGESTRGKYSSIHEAEQRVHWVSHIQSLARVPRACPLWECAKNEVQIKLLGRLGRQLRLVWLLESRRRLGCREITH
jgi:hypothetical protein